MVRPTLGIEELRAAIADLPDPEIPVITITDLGILRDVEIVDGVVVVTITPTYSGCPAMGQIKSDIVSRLQAAGADQVEVVTTYTPAWTTEWMTDSARAALEEYGIAPPSPDPSQPVEITCPRCGADTITVISHFASTACKALMVCDSCLEPFDHFKDH